MCSAPTTAGADHPALIAAAQRAAEGLALRKSAQTDVMAKVIRHQLGEWVSAGPGLPSPDQLESLAARALAVPWGFHFAVVEAGGPEELDLARVVLELLRRNPGIVRQPPEDLGGVNRQLVEAVGVLLTRGLVRTSAQRGGGGQRRTTLEVSDALKQLMSTERPGWGLFHSDAPPELRAELRACVDEALERFESGKVDAVRQVIADMPRLLDHPTRFPKLFETLAGLLQAGAWEVIVRTRRSVLSREMSRAQLALRDTLEDCCVALDVAKLWIDLFVMERELGHAVLRRNEYEAHTRNFGPPPQSKTRRRLTDEASRESSAWRRLSAACAVPELAGRRNPRVHEFATQFRRGEVSWEGPTARVDRPRVWPSESTLSAWLVRSSSCHATVYARLQPLTDEVGVFDAPVLFEAAVRKWPALGTLGPPGRMAFERAIGDGALPLDRSAAQRVARAVLCHRSTDVGRHDRGIDTVPERPGGEE